MTPINQTIFNSVHGDCYRACIASLLDKPIEEVPNFVEREDWSKACEEYMNAQNYEYTQYLINGNRTDRTAEEKEKYKWFREELPAYGHFGGYYDAVVYSATLNGSGNIEFCHAVVCDKNFNIVHDPNPVTSGRKQYPMSETIGHNGIIGVSLWVPIKQTII